jgi:hypothetical protein
LETASLATLLLADWSKASICNTEKERVKEELKRDERRHCRCRRDEGGGFHRQFRLFNSTYNINTVFTTKQP